MVGVLPGYIGGSLAYRRELRGQGGQVAGLALTSTAGGLAGSIALILSPAAVFRDIVPFLILAACALLAAEPLLGRLLVRPDGGRRRGRRVGLHASLFAGAVYGGFFGAGLGIMFLAILSLFLDEDLQSVNALKGVLSLLVSAVAVVCFAAFGPVQWGPAALIGAASLAGGHLGVGLARRLDAAALRGLVVVFGVAVAVVLLVS
jgi:uncharacterized membrane protein YfcA